MKKILFTLLLSVFIFMFIGSSQPIQALQKMPTILMQINGTYSMYAGMYIGSPVTFNVPYPVKVTIHFNIQGAPPNTVFGYKWTSPDNGCPPEMGKVNGFCYPIDITAVPKPPFTISAKALAEKGNTRKLIPMVRWCPGGEHHISGTISISFTPIWKLIKAKPVIKVILPPLDTMVSGKDIIINWPNRGVIGKNVMIRLVSILDPKLSKTISARAPNNGSFTWKNSRLIPGKFRFEILSMERKVVGKSNLFTIK